MSEIKYIPTPEGASPQAVRACADWLNECLRIGWKKSQLDDLQSLWWRYHDKDGNEIPTEPQASAPLPEVQR